MEDPLLTLPTTTINTNTNTNTNIRSAKAVVVGADAFEASTPRILIRMLFVAAVAAVSLWAQREASRGFGISVVVDDPWSPAGRRFGLAFASNGRAERLVHRAGRLAARALYPDPDAFPPKPVSHVTLRVAAHAALPSPAAAVVPGARPEEYVIHLDPSVLVMLTSSAEADAAVSRAVQRAVARVLMWGDPPEEVAGAVADYVASAAATPPPRVSGAREPDVGASCWSEGFVRYCEARREGFVARLNREARAPWSGRAVESALGEPLERACAAYSRRRLRRSPQSVESGARSTSASRNATSAL